MTNDINIKVTANTTEIQRAEKELGTLEKSVQKVRKSLGDSSAAWQKYSSVVTACSTSFMAVQSAIQNYVIAPLAGAVNSFMTLGDTISKTSQRLGIGTDALGGLKFAAEQCGANFDVLTEGIKAFQSTLGAAQMGETGGIGKLANVGLSADDFAGLDNEQQLMKLADHIKAIGDKSQQTRVALELFGKAGFKLLPFFQEGSEGIRKLIEEGKDIGAVLGEDSVQSAVELTDAMNRMKTSAANISNVFIGSLAPAITSVLDGITSLAKGTSRLIANYGPLVTGIGGAVAAFATMKAVMLSTTTVIPALVAGFHALKVAMLSNPYLLAGAVIIGGIAAAWSAWNKHVKATEEHLNKLLGASKKHREEIEKMEKALGAAEDAELKLLQRLEEINNLEDPLSNDQIREAQLLIEELESRYGDLGLEIDATTGKIKGLAEAQEKMIDQLAEKRLVELGGQQEKLSETKLELEQRRFHADSEIRRYKGLLQDPELSEGAKSLYNDKIKQHEKERDLYNSQLAEINKQKLALLEEQTALRNGTFKLGSKGGVQGKPETWQELNKKNTTVEAENAKEKEEARKELEGMKADPDLDFRDPLTKAYADLAEKTQAKYDALERRIELTKKAGGEGVDDKVAALEAERDKIEQWRQQELEKIGQGVINERQKEADEEYAAWKERNPELEKPEVKDSRIVSAEAKVQEARDNQAEAILTGVGLPEADAELKTAQEELAKTIAEVSGENRIKAQKEWADAQAAYDKAKADGKDNQTLNALLETVKKAQAKYEQENEAYFSAVGSLRKEKEDEIADAIQTTLSSAGTFSAYGMDAVATSDIPQQTLDVLRKLLDTTDEIKEEQKNDGAFSK